MGLTVTQLAYAFGGSNPSLPTKPHALRRAISPFLRNKCGVFAEVAQSIEH